MDEINQTLIELVDHFKSLTEQFQILEARINYALKDCEKLERLTAATVEELS